MEVELNQIFRVLLISFVLIMVLAVAPAMAQEPTSTPTVWTVEEAVTLYTISGTYSVTECLYEGQTEPNCWEFRGVIQMENPFETQWIDGYRRCSGEVRLQYAGMERADRISVPPAYMTTPNCFLEVLIARPEAPAQNAMEARGESEVQWSLEEAISFFELAGPTATVRSAIHGLQSWEIQTLDDDQSYLVTNVCHEWMDAMRTVPGEIQPGFEAHPDAELVGVPPHSYQTAVTMVTLRICENSQQFLITPLGDQNINLRAEPSQESQVTGSLVVGQSLPSDGFVVVDDELQWYRVWVGDTPAWVASWVVNIMSINVNAPAQVAEATPPNPTLEPEAVLTAVPTVAAPASTPVPAQSDWTEATVRALFGIPADSVATSCGESCWEFHNVTLTNKSGCWQSGYTTTEHELWEELGQTDQKTGIPPNWSGTVEVAKLVPCN